MESAIANSYVNRKDSAAARDRVNMLGVGVMPMDIPRALEILDSWHAAGRRDYVCCVTVHGLVTSQRDPHVRQAINRAGLATQDGMPLVWWSRLAGRQASRVCGPDLMDAICAHSISRGYRHYFYGASPATLAQMTARLSARHPGLIVAGTRSPPYRALTQTEIAEDIAAINETKPDFVWVGLGMPKQERWMATHLGAIQATALMGVGAAFDFHAGAISRAPGWMQRSGTEWLFRLACEPRRLARRYLVDNAVFVSHAALQLAGWRTYAREW